MDTRLKECIAKRVRDDAKAHQDLVNGSKDAVTKYFNSLKTSGADKDICLRRLRTEFRYFIENYRKNLLINSEEFEEKSLENYNNLIGPYIDSFYEEK